jgi:hypothetical protein
MMDSYFIYTPEGVALDGFESPTKTPRNVLILLGYMDELGKRYADTTFRVCVEISTGKNEDSTPIIELETVHTGTPSEIIEQAKQFVLNPEQIAYLIAKTVKQSMSQSTLQAAAVTMVSVMPDGRPAVGAFSMFTEVPPAGDDIAALLLQGLVNHGTKMKDELSTKLENQKKAEGLTLA